MELRLRKAKPTIPTSSALREQQIRNFLTILLVSQGTPMIVMGDEVRRTQCGNNNVYGQDNELGWFNWDDVEQHGDLLRFTRGLIRFIQEHKIFHSEQFWSSLDEDQQMEITWHGTQLDQPDWGELGADAGVLARASAKAAITCT